MQGIVAGQHVTIKPEWRDAGDEGITFIAVENESGGRVRIEAQLGMPLNPTYVVRTDWIEQA